MTLVQRVLISAQSLVDRFGILDSKVGRGVYFKVYLFYKKNYESKSLREALKYLQLSAQNVSIRTTLDIGAHIGSSTYLIGEAFPDSQIIAFEPDLRNCQFYRQIHSRQISQRKIVLVEKAVWKTSGKIPFSFEKSNTANNKFSPQSKQSVSCISIDDYVKQNRLNIDLVKIDVQGFELEVLQGTVLTLTQQKPLILMEIDLESLNWRNHDLAHLVKSVRRFGYRIVNTRDGSEVTEVELESLLENNHCLDFLLEPSLS
jgi:FkbM family methyltransferase